MLPWTLQAHYAMEVPLLCCSGKCHDFIISKGLDVGLPPFEICVWAAPEPPDNESAAQLCCHPVTRAVTEHVPGKDCTAWTAWKWWSAALQICLKWAKAKITEIQNAWVAQMFCLPRHPSNKCWIGLLLGKLLLQLASALTSPLSLPFWCRFPLFLEKTISLGLACD